VPASVRLLDVLIASPGDAAKAGAAVERAAYDWNNHRGPSEGYILRPRRWEMASVAISGRGDPQKVINGQIVDHSDIVFGVFRHRLGTATPRDISGTVEEVNRAIQNRKAVHLFFSNEPVPQTADFGQFEALKHFRAEMEKQGLVGAFDSLEDLVLQVRRAIELDIGDFGHTQGVILGQDIDASPEAFVAAFERARREQAAPRDTTDRTSENGLGQQMKVTDRHGDLSARLGLMGNEPFSIELSPAKKMHHINLEVFLPRRFLNLYRPRFIAANTVGIYPLDQAGIRSPRPAISYRQLHNFARPTPLPLSPREIAVTVSWHEHESDRIDELRLFSYLQTSF
jgi:hypothetical protein